MKLEENPNNHFMEKTVARDELEKIGEPISDRRFKDICEQKFSAEYRDIKMIYQDPTIDIDQMQSAMRHLYLDDLYNSSGAKGKIIGRGML